MWGEVGDGWWKAKVKAFVLRYQAFVSCLQGKEEADHLGN